MLKSAGYADPVFKRVDAALLVGKSPRDSMESNSWVITARSRE